MDIISGYIIVRKPQYENVYIDGPSLQPLTEIYYNGLQRSQWFDIGTKFYDGTLTGSLLEKYKVLTSSNDTLFIDLTQNIEDAKAFLACEDEILKTTEIIAISSPSINEIRGTLSVPTGQINWLGYDFFLFGGLSLIRHAIFENRQLSLLTHISLNKYGLAPDTSQFEDFIEAYEKLSESNLVEPLTNLSYVEPIRIGRLI